MNRAILDKSAILFCAILLATALLELLYPHSLRSLGISALLWSILCAVILLWIEERYHYLRTNPQISTSYLPSKLIAEMDRQAIYDQGMLALKGLNRLTLYFIMAGGLYVLSGLYSVALPYPYEQLIKLDERLDDYFLMVIEPGIYNKAHISFFTNVFTILNNTLPIIIIGLGFWLSQIFAYGTRAGRYILYFCIGLFVLISALAFSQSEFLGFAGMKGPLTLWNGYGWDNIEPISLLGAAPQSTLSAYQTRLYETGLQGIIAFYAAPALMLLVFLRNLLSEEGARIKACMGLFILVTLFVVDTFISNPNMSLSLALSGWCSMSFLCVTRKFGVRKIYRMYQ